MGALERVSRWRPALRMAWRDLLAHRVRTAVVVVLVALPVAVAVVAATVAVTTDYRSANGLYVDHGAADAQVDVTPYAQVRSRLVDGGRYTDTRPARGADEVRDPLDVDVAALLPEGSRVTPIGYTQVRLATGGTATGRVLDLADPLTRGLDEIASGRAPEAPDEAAVSPTVARAFDLVDGDRLRDGATLALADGELRVTGLLTPAPGEGEWGGLRVVVPPGSVTLADRLPGDDVASYLVDLPEMDVAAGQALRRDLAAAGVGSWVRAAAEDPAAWGLSSPARPAGDPVAVAVGALVIGVGLVEVLVLVGAAFAVGARRQGRTLGLLVAAGGTTADVRRTVLAQGVWIGLAAALLGVAGGAGVLVLGRRRLGALVDQRLIEYSVPVVGVVAIALLGALSAVLAAAVPAWGVGRLTARQALDGHVAVGPRAAAHRWRGAGLWLVALGLVGLLACGFRIASAYAPSRDQVGSAVPVLLGALSALALLAGTTLVLPWVVTEAGRAGGRGRLPWRLAVRDAARHRGRTTAAVLAIGVVTTGAVFAGFGLQAQAATPTSQEQSPVPAEAAELYTTPAPGGLTGETAGRIERTAAEVGLDARVVTWSEARAGRRPLNDRTGQRVRVVDETYLDAVGADDATRTALADGSVVVTAPRLVRDGEVVLRVGRGRSADRREVPAVVARTTTSGGFEPVWLSRETAEGLGYDVRPASTAWLVANRPLTQADSDALRLYGIDAYVDAPYVQDNTRYVLPVVGGTLALIALVVGLVVALAAADGRDDSATLTAVGAPPGLRRAVGAGHALFVGVLGAGVGLVVGGAGGASLLQVVGSPGTPVPWAGLGALLLGVPLLCAAAGWLVVPTRLTLTRRTA
ncbi:hypothetical protein GCM10023340_44760 [Nocardioides marinquilinus]|uniref:FtsX-like permease family protein n=1 Tax=Nocardioides marinquilinus TaxID=1210400 RepID=A0ABP9Q4W7_9ACTN